MRAWSLVLLVMAACGSSRSVENTSFGTLAFQIPSEYGQKRTISDVYTERAEWTPIDNADKQSIVIVHTSPHPADIQAGTAQLQQRLESSQRTLGRASFGKATHLRANDFGFGGVVIEGSFVPEGQTATYHRLHAVLVDHQLRSFVHVLFTGRVVDREAFEIVLDTLSRGV